MSSTSRTIRIADRLAGQWIDTGAEGAPSADFIRAAHRALTRPDRRLFDGSPDLWCAVQVAVERKRADAAPAPDRFTAPGFHDPGGDSVSFDLGGNAA